MELNKKGFTLVELIPVLLILSLAMISVGMVVNFGLETNRRQTIQTEVQENARRAILDFTDNVRKGVDFINYEGRTNEQLKGSFANLDIHFDSGDEIYEITSSKGFEGILFIRQINGRYCLYATKAETLYRFDFTAVAIVDADKHPESVFEPVDGTQSRIDENTRVYYLKYKFNVDPTGAFYFYQGSKYFKCYQDVFGNYNIQEIVKNDVILANTPTEVQLADLIESVTVTERSGAYDFRFVLSKKNNMTGMFTDRTLSSSVACVNYGGDEDED